MDGNGYRKRLQDSIEFIEANLREELSLRDVSRQANASLYHFHRLFRAFMGESLKEYIRHRRLAQAASDLVKTRRPIIDIALDYRYAAPESFLRAFKAMFGTTPSRFRRRGRIPAIHAKADLLASTGTPFIKGGGAVKPNIMERYPFTLIGEVIHTRHGACKKEVAGFWARERAKVRIGGLAQAAGASSVFGVCFGACDGCGTGLEPDSEAFPYLIGWEAEKGAAVPDGLVEMTIPGGRYARFVVEGGLADIEKAVNLIYGAWLPASSCELSDSPVLERYDMGWTGSRGQSMEIWLPIR